MDHVGLHLESKETIGLVGESASSTDQPILHRIQEPVAEEQKLRGHTALSDADVERLSKLEVE